MKLSSVMHIQTLSPCLSTVLELPHYLVLIKCILVYLRKDPLLSTQVLSPDTEPAAWEELCNLQQKPRHAVHLFMYCITAELCCSVTCAQRVFMSVSYLFICDRRFMRPRFCVCGCAGACACTHQAGGCCCLAGCPVSSGLIRTNRPGKRWAESAKACQVTQLFTPGSEQSTRHVSLLMNNTRPTRPDGHCRLHLHCVFYYCSITSQEMWLVFNLMYWMFLSL